MGPSVYLDSTIPSFYFEDRPGKHNQSWREVTEDFWNFGRFRYDVFISGQTLDELRDESYPAQKREKCLQLIEGIVVLEPRGEIGDLAVYYMREGLMPSQDSGDAIHLAFATWYRIDYLLSWNCKHLANANKFMHMDVLNRRQGLKSPFVVTPMQLMEVKP